MASSWLPASFKPNISLSNGDSHPLLPTNGALGEDDDDQEIELEMRRFARDERSPGVLARLRNSPPWCILVALLVVIVLLATIAFRRPSSRPPRPSSLVYHNYRNASMARIDAMYARQSSSLEQARARYSVRNNRAPPPMYDQWYDFARERSCIIDDYEQISRDFEPFYQLAQDDPKFFKRMVDLATAEVQRDGRGMTTGKFENHHFSLTDSMSTLYSGDWPRTLNRFAHFMPDMNVILNGRDEPRILVNARKPDTRAKALLADDPTPFGHSPTPTGPYFKDEMGCVVPNRPKGFTGAANDASAFMLYASSMEFTTNMYPLLSMTKISPCFSDIVVPSEFYYYDAGWSPKYGHPDNVNWTEKIPKLYWRGMNSGGRMYGDNYHAFPRFRLIDIGRKHTDIMDVAISSFHGDLCGDKCDEKAIKHEYNIVDQSAPREEVYKYKYVFDVDGNSFSGRYFGLLRSGTLVFKSTVFLEYFGDWLRPFEHYIPVLPDLSDLVDKLEWAVAHDDEAHRIQQAGQAFAERVLTDAQNDCYFSLVMLEWARLQNMANPGNAPAPSPPPAPGPDIPEPEATD